VKAPILTKEGVKKEVRSGLWNRRWAATGTHNALECKHWDMGVVKPRRCPGGSRFLTSCETRTKKSTTGEAERKDGVKLPGKKKTQQKVLWGSTVTEYPKREKQ